MITVESGMDQNAKRFFFHSKELKILLVHSANSKTCKVEKVKQICKISVYINESLLWDFMASHNFSYTHSSIIILNLVFTVTMSVLTRHFVQVSLPKPTWCRMWVFLSVPFCWLLYYRLLNLVCITSCCKGLVLSAVLNFHNTLDGFWRLFQSCS